MAARVSIDDRLSALERDIDAADGDELAAVLNRALALKSYRIVAYAAHQARERFVYAALPALLAAYRHFLDQPVKRDPNCLAKKAIARALFELDCDDEAFYLSAIRYRQMEPVWGGSVDTATDVRCSAAMGLVSSGYPRALVELAALLTDEEAPVRAGAVRAIACGNPREAEPLLRAKVFAGDDEAFVIGECFTALLEVEPDESPGFVASFLEHENDDLREAAALALGESRLPNALDAIQAAWDGVYVPRELKRVLLRAAALHRSDAAFDWLLALAGDGEARVAAEIIDVLSIYRHNAKLAKRLREILRGRDDAKLEAQFEAAWA